jgi:hypothetical protein
MGLGLPQAYVGAQHLPRGLRVGQWLGGQHFDALGHQERRFALHLGAVLQVFYQLDALGQLGFDRGQGFFGQRCARFGGIALPGQRIGHIEFAASQQCLGFVGPLCGHMFLGTGAFDLVELFTQGFGRAFVFDTQLFEHRLHLLAAGVGSQPIAHAGSAVTRRGGAKGTTSKFV